MNDERQKKIEAGKLKLAEFQRKCHRKPKSNLTIQNPEHLDSCEPTNLKNMGDKQEVTDNSSLTMKEISVEGVSKKSTPTRDSALPQSDEGSEDTDLMLDSKQAMLVSCLEQKLEKYRISSKQKDLMIQQLSSQLASAMTANEAVNLASSEVVENLKAEINMLHVQVKEAAEMIEKQKSKTENRENDQVNEIEYTGMHKKSLENDNFSEDNLMLEESPLSCISLLSLTDSEYRAEYITDSETNSTPKFLSIPRPLQDGDLCTECEREFEIMKNKHEGHICYLKKDIETILSIEKDEVVKNLNLKIEETKLENQNMQTEMVKHTEILCKEHESKIQNLICEQQKQLSQFQNCLSKWNAEKDQLVSNIRNLEEKLVQKNKELSETLNEKANIEFSLQKQIADLVEEHKEDLEARNLAKFEQFTQEKKRIESEHASSIEILKKLHEQELDNLKKTLTKEFENKEQFLRTEHSNVVSSMGSAHFEECQTYQKKIDQLLEEKCELLSKTAQEYEAILKKNHKVLVSLCNQLRCKLFSCKKKIINESTKSVNGDIEASFTDALDELSENIEKGIVSFLNEHYFDENECEKMEYTHQLASEINSCVSEIESAKSTNASNTKKEIMNNINEQNQGSETGLSLSETSLKSEDVQMIHAEAKKLQDEFQKDIAVYMEVNEQLHTELQLLQAHAKELEDQKKKLELQLLEKDKELNNKQVHGASVDNGCLKGCLSSSQLSSSDIKSWQVDVAQTNSRLLHVLSDMVQTFFDIEQDINRHLCAHGLMPLCSGTIGLHEDETNHSVGSKEDFASLSFSECPNIELAEDGPDLTPRTWDMFSAVGVYENEMEGEDVVLGASRRLRIAVDHVLNLLTRALDNQQNQDLKLLLKRNEELSQELQEESKGRDAVQMELITAESTIRKLENEKQKLNDMINDLKDNQELLNREINIEKNKNNYLTREKENANDEIQTLRNQCELLASRLGDPEKIDTNKMLNSPDSHVNEKPELLQENSRLSTEKHNVQINLSKERQSFLDRLQQMEMALDDLNAEKDELMESKCKEIRDLKAEMEAMEKQLISNKKFIEEQAQERELEREEYLKELNKMQEIVRDKEKIQSNEEQLTKEIESLEQLLRARVEDHQIAMQKKDAVESELRQSVDKIRDLHDVIEELEKQLNIKTKIEAELHQKLSTLTETINDQERRNSFLDEEITLARKENSSVDSTEQVQNLKEQLACQTQEIEEMSQNRTLLQELRGQIHFLEAKVDQRAKQLEKMSFSSKSPILSAEISPTSSQDNESLQLPYEDGMEMSPRSIHWLEIRRLEEKIGRLVHIDEELIKKNRDLDQNLKALQHLQTEYEQENAVLQEKLSEQLMQVSALKSFIDEQKHRTATTHNSMVTNQKVDELQEACESLQENNRQLLYELQEKSNEYNTLREEIEKKDFLITSLQRNLHSNEKQKDDSTVRNGEDSSCLKLLLLEKEEELNSKVQMVELLSEKLKELQINTENSVSACQNLKEEIEDRNKLLEDYQTENVQLKSEVEALKEKVNSVKEALDNSKTQIEYEQAQIEALCEELSNTTKEKKKLENELDALQIKMQQKEKELTASHKGTDIQVQLETNINNLQKELENKKIIEEELKQKIHQMKATMKTFKNVLKNEKEQWKLHVNNLEKMHDLEVTNLKKQIEILDKNNCGDSVEDIDLASIKNEILEAAKAFNLRNADDFKKYNETVYALLKKAVDIKLKHLQKKHEGDVSTINENWQQKIKIEFENKLHLESECEKYKMELFQLQEKLNESNKLDCDKEVYWQTKLTEIEKALKLNLKEAHKKELLFLQNNIEQLSKQKTLFEIEAKDLSQQVEVYKCQVENLQQQLDLAAEREKNAELKHKEEFAHICNLFETRWNNEMKKIVAIQINELEKLKNSKEKNVEVLCNHLVAEYEKKLKELKEECIQVTEQHYLSKQQYETSLQRMQQTLKMKYEDERKNILLIKEKEIAELKNALEEKKKVLKVDKSLSPYKKDNKEWEVEKQKIITHYEKKLTELEQKLQKKYEKILQNHLQAHDASIRNIEETYNQRMEEVSELIKVATNAATGSLHSDSGSNRTTTPSSDEACSSCKEDMLAENKLLLAEKIHQDGKRILNIIESSAAEAHGWLEEKRWIMDKLRSLNIFAIENQGNLKTMVNSLCEEIFAARNRLKNCDQEIVSLRKKCTALGDQMDKITNAKFISYSPNTSPRRRLSTEINAVIRSNVNEMIMRNSPEELRLILSSSASRNSSPLTNESSNALSNEVVQLRSADTPKSLQKFTTILPEIGNSSSPVKLNKTTEEVHPKSDISLLEVTDEIVQLPNENEQLSRNETENINQFKNHLSNVCNNSLSMPNNNINEESFAAKMHGLYWVFRKSLSYNKSLIYQKKYLLMLLKGFQLTEKVTLSYVKKLEKNAIFGTESNTSSVSTDAPCNGRAHFRAIVFVAIAIHRMKYYVKRWRLLAKVPTLQVVDAEVQSIFQSFPNVSILSPNGFNMSSLSLSSKSTSTCESDYYQQQNELFLGLNSSASSVNSRSGVQVKRKPDRGQLCEIVQRLDMLQKQLGLDNLR